MKRIGLFVLAMLLLAPVVASAAGPYLVADPMTGVSYFVVTGLPAAIDGTHILPDATNIYAFKLDLATLANGTYTVKAKACTSIGRCSADSSPFVFTFDPVPGIPQNIRLSQ